MSGATSDIGAAVQSLTIGDKQEAEIGSATGDEIMDASAEFANGFPLGFAIDAGGSVTKLVYRAKRDYTDGKSNTGKDVLRLRFFPNGDGTELVKFLQENCDVRKTSSEDLPTYYQTGVGVQHYSKLLEEKFHCRIKIASEFDSLITGVLTVPSQLPLFKTTAPYSVRSAERALNRIREMMQVFMGFEAAGMSLTGTLPPPKDTEVDIPAFIMKLMSTDPVQLAEDLSSKPIEFPCIIVQCGSASVTAVLNEHGQFGFGDFNCVAGKTFLALGRALTGAQTFDELILLASTGNSDKVDLLSGDMKNKSRQEVDWYSLMPNDSPLFMLGKMAESKFDGTYTKNDIAAALLQIYCIDLARMAINQCRIHNKQSVLFTGSIVQCQTSRQVLQEHFLILALNLTLTTGKSAYMHVLPHCGFHAAIGVWHDNVKTHVVKTCAD